MAGDSAPKQTSFLVRKSSRGTSAHERASTKLTVAWPFKERTKEATAMDVIRVAAKSRSTSVAGAIAGVIRESGRAEVQAIGAGAVNQAVKATAIARGYLALDGMDVICIPSFVEVIIEGQERTAIRLCVEPR